MVAKQRIRMANEKHSKNITQRGNVAKTLVSLNSDGSVTASEVTFTPAQTQQGGDDDGDGGDDIHSLGYWSVIWCPSCRSSV